MSVRLYIDESGDHASARADDQHDKRYLCVAGCAFDKDYHRDKFTVSLEALKLKHFGGDPPDDPVILHRRDICQKRGPFSVLDDPAKCAVFDDELIELLKQSAFVFFAVVIDKYATPNKKYGLPQYHPYNIAVLVLLERYCGYLRFSKKQGDVLAESRGKSEDAHLKNAYRSIYHCGTSFYSPAQFQKVLSSKEIKIKPKAHNIAGIQLADILAHPARRDVLRAEGILTAQASGYSARITDVLQRKYNSRYLNDQIKGYGRIYLP
jgi:hypothetical protein